MPSANAVSAPVLGNLHHALAAKA